MYVDCRSYTAVRVCPEKCVLVSLLQRPSPIALSIALLQDIFSFGVTLSDDTSGLFSGQNIQLDSTHTGWAHWHNYIPL